MFDWLGGGGPSPFPQNPLVGFLSGFLGGAMARQTMEDRKRQRKIEDAQLKQAQEAHDLQMKQSQAILQDRMEQERTRRMTASQYASQHPGGLRVRPGFEDRTIGELQAAGLMGEAFIDPRQEAMQQIQSANLLAGLTRQPQPVYGSTITALGGPEPTTSVPAPPSMLPGPAGVEGPAGEIARSRGLTQETAATPLTSGVMVQPPAQVPIVQTPKGPMPVDEAVKVYGQERVAEWMGGGETESQRLARERFAAEEATRRRTESTAAYTRTLTQLRGKLRSYIAQNDRAGVQRVMAQINQISGQTGTSANAELDTALKDARKEGREEEHLAIARAHLGLSAQQVSIAAAHLKLSEAEFVQRMTDAQAKADNLKPNERQVLSMFNSPNFYTLPKAQQEGITKAVAPILRKLGVEVTEEDLKKPAPVGAPSPLQTIIDAIMKRGRTEPGAPSGAGPSTPVSPAPAGAAKTISTAELRLIAQRRGISIDVARQQAIQQGYQVTP